MCATFTSRLRCEGIVHAIYMYYAYTVHVVPGRPCLMTMQKTCVNSPMHMYM